MSELDIFKSLKNIRIVFDVGAKGTKYPELKPKAKYHLFEPNPIFFSELPKGDNIIANNYGLGDEAKMGNYNKRIESFGGSEALPHGDDGELYPIKTLDWYIEENKIKRIDFLKIDTEGMDYKVLLGGKNAIKLARYIQYEHWDNTEQFHTLLEASFHMQYIGLRNVLCTKK